MSTISQYTFTNAFNTDKLTQRQVQEMGVQSYTIQAADTDGNGELTFEEIIANTTLCDEIMAYIASTKLHQQMQLLNKRHLKKWNKHLKKNLVFLMRHNINKI